MKKKRLLTIFTFTLSGIALASCGGGKKDNDADTGITYDLGYSGLNCDMPDFSVYEDTNAYRKVSNASELISALKDSRIEYTTTLTSYVHNGDESDYSPLAKTTIWKKANWEKFVKKGLYVKINGEYIKVPEDTPWDPDSTTYTADMSYYEDSKYATVEYEQTITKEASVHVIEITNDIDLGWNHLSSTDISSGIVNNFADSTSDSIFTKSSMYEENGISQFLIERTNDLLIYSKNGSKLTHGGFKINYCKNVAIRNLEMDEMWQWEDASSTTTGAVGDYDSYGWAYFKIGYSKSVWIDHCTFGKSFDGLIDVSNPYYQSAESYQSAPYGADGTSSVHISYCNFNAGSDDKNGYLYKMMQEVEADYNSNGGKYLYYKALRDAGFTFDDILYGIAIPQKKGFLDGDSGTEAYYNYNLRVSIANTKFTNLEDRIPKVRGGVAYMYNCIIDNSEYYAKRTDLKSRNIASAVQTINSTWKCGMVSQGIVCGNGGSVAAKNCIFKGIEYLLKNNDDKIKNDSNKSGVSLNGGYYIVNCSYQKSATDAVTTSDFTNSTPSTLTEGMFTWRTEDGNVPFKVARIELSGLENQLTQNVSNWTKVKY